MADDLYNTQPTQNTGVSTSKNSVESSISQPKSDNAQSITDVFVTAGLGLLIIATIVVLSTVTVMQIRKRKAKERLHEQWKDMDIMEISVPKESIEQVQKDGGSKGDDKLLISVGEQIFSVMSEYTNKGFKNWWAGGERFSLEIVSMEQEVRFWMVCSNKMSAVIARQIIAVYPKANITMVKNTNFFKPGTVGYGVELDLAQRFELPFKTYRNLDQEPLNTLTNALTGLTKEESATIQLVLTPITSDWQKSPRILASEIQQGKAPNEILNPPSGFKKFTKEVKKTLKSNSKDDQKADDLSGKDKTIQLTPQQQEIIKKLEEKASRPGFKFALRVVAAAADESRAKSIVDGIVPAFQIFDNRPFNYIKKQKKPVKNVIIDYSYRALNSTNNIINTEEINSLWHLPNYLTQTSAIKWLMSRKPPIPLILPGSGGDRILLGTAESRGEKKEVWIGNEDRFRHTYALGGSGTGKSYMMVSIIENDMKNGNGVCVIDPHGELVDEVLMRVPDDRLDDVIVFSPAFIDRPLGLNMLETDPLKPEQKTLMIENLFSIWDKLYDLKATGGPMFEQYMKNAMRLIMSHPESGSTLMEIQKVLIDEDYRAFKLAMCDEPEVVDFWQKTVANATGEGSLENMVPYFVSKLAPFVTNDFLKPMIGQSKSAINFREAMDNKKIILVKLEKGLIGETSAYLVGMVIVGNLVMAGMGRTDGLNYNSDGTTTKVEAHERTPFFVYIDEMQNFLFDAIPKALEEIRKYKVGFYLAHQFVKQIIPKGDERIKDSIMANCANKFIYRVSADDAKYLESEFQPELTSNDLMNPEKYTINARILVDGQKTTPFSLRPAAISDGWGPERKALLIQMTKDKYGKSPEEVAKEMKDRTDLPF
jgi:hypothetical protein